MPQGGLHLPVPTDHGYAPAAGTDGGKAGNHEGVGSASSVNGAGWMGNGAEFPSNVHTGNGLPLTPQEQMYYQMLDQQDRERMLLEYGYYLPYDDLASLHGPPGYPHFHMANQQQQHQEHHQQQQRLHQREQQIHTPGQGPSAVGLAGQALHQGQHQGQHQQGPAQPPLGTGTDAGYWSMGVGASERPVTGRPPLTLPVNSPFLLDYPVELLQKTPAQLVQEYSDRHPDAGVAHYDVSETDDPDPRQRYNCIVEMKNLRATGQGPNKKSCKQVAAQHLLHLLHPEARSYGELMALYTPGKKPSLNRATADERGNSNGPAPAALSRLGPHGREHGEHLGNGGMYSNEYGGINGEVFAYMNGTGGTSGGGASGDGGNGGRVGEQHLHDELARFGGHDVWAAAYPLYHPLFPTGEGSNGAGNPPESAPGQYGADAAMYWHAMMARRDQRTRSWHRRPSPLEMYEFDMMG
eukprot:TRINITY_DN1681_c0_g1_i2.p2 TRINITY_DN1681_c0_g1~~TRINITY_DN1681_c0_g1_i2.p2  ORF type:complete len:466 (-),score=84.28 TRINITY_DN1681_c0_g1_i2:80-1477(-)